MARPDGRRHSFLAALLRRIQGSSSGEVAKLHGRESLAQNTNWMHPYRGNEEPKFKAVVLGLGLKTAQHLVVSDWAPGFSCRIRDFLKPGSHSNICELSLLPEDTL